MEDTCTVDLQEYSLHAYCESNQNGDILARRRRRAALSEKKKKAKVNCTDGVRDGPLRTASLYKFAVHFVFSVHVLLVPLSCSGSEKIGGKHMSAQNLRVHPSDDEIDETQNRMDAQILTYPHVTSTHPCFADKFNGCNFFVC